jgi:hypothetical protein
VSDNLKIWDALYKTDPAHVKPITGKAYSGDSPKPQYIIWRLTEQFGPVGKCFGWKVLAEHYVDGIPHQDGHEKIHECRIEFWWGTMGGTDAGVVESYGATKALYKSRKGEWISDEDAAKKSLTDAIVKAASWLGAAGDIFMGQWNDSKYQAELRAEKRDADKTPKPSDDGNVPSPTADRPSDFDLAVAVAIQNINSARDEAELKQIWVAYGKSAVLADKRVLDAKEARKKLLHFPGDDVESERWRGDAAQRPARGAA